jgi:hypothetical protein
MSVIAAIKEFASVDIFEEGLNKENFMGRPFYLDYNKAHLLVADSWKNRVKGLPHGTFLLAFYDNEETISEALLLRVLRPTKLPTDSDVIASMIEFYKDNLKTAGKESKLDEFTRYEFSFSGLECRILGTFYKDADNNLVYGADLENFYSAHNYSVYKATGKVLEVISNLRDGDEIPGGESEARIGQVRYSSSQRFQEELEEVPVYISPKDFLGKRTALFGMTRTGKSNTVKKIIQASVDISMKAKYDLAVYKPDKVENILDPFEEGAPKFPVGQIIFDINGEYANPNLQDEGTAIYELYKKDVIRYSVIEKEGFKTFKVNFYNDIPGGFSLVTSNLQEDRADYVRSFLAISLEEPEDPEDMSATTRYARLKAAYLSCLYSAGFPAPPKFKISFPGRKEINSELAGGIDPSKGITLDQAVIWFSAVWENYNSFDFFNTYKSKRGKEWADEDLKAVLVFLTRKRTPGRAANISGYRKIRNLINFHTNKAEASFEDDILGYLRGGKIVIVDLSQGDPLIQTTFSERLCRAVFNDAMKRFVDNAPNNYIQMYFEEAHNLFPRKEDRDLSQIYNRLAKEGAKLNLGIAYATQEVSSISTNILKNTQNFFVAHLNNVDELKELVKYYDFDDFSENLIRFSARSDKGYVRMKTYSNPFVVPVQIDRFTVKDE